MSNDLTKPALLRHQMRRRGLLCAVGTPDGLSARLVEANRFEAIPDINVLVGSNAAISDACTLQDMTAPIGAVA
jgi:hypothetical protein